MYTDIISDPLTKPAPETQPTSAAMLFARTEVEFAMCDCCGLTEECTNAYIERIRERYHGKWICGLCAEAIKDEIIRAERLLSTEEAMARHINFCNRFKSSELPQNPTIHWISVVRQLLRRSLESRSNRSSPTRTDLAGPALVRSEPFPKFRRLRPGTKLENGHNLHTHDDGH